MGQGIIFNSFVFYNPLPFSAPRCLCGSFLAADRSGITCNAPLTYTGHSFDQESGLFYFGARYYDPETGRFLTNDPVAGDALNPPSLHKYLYAYDSPMVYTDPWGEYIDNGDGSTLQADSEFLYKVTGGRFGDRYKDNQSLSSVVSAVKCATSKNGAYAAMGTPELKNALNSWRTKEGGVNQQAVAMIDFYFHRFFDNLQQQDNYGFVLDEAHQTHGIKGELTPTAAAGLGILSGLGKAAMGVITAPSTLVKIIEDAPDEMRREIEIGARGRNPMQEIALNLKAQVESTLQAASEDPYKAGELFGGALGTAATFAAPYAKIGEVAEAAEAAKIAEASRSIVVKEPWQIPGFHDLSQNAGPISINLSPTGARSLGAAAADGTVFSKSIGGPGLMGRGGAFEAMMNKVDALDFSTSPDGAVFYSGPGQRAAAMAFAGRSGKMTIDMTKGGEALAQDPIFKSLSREQQYQVWRKASTPFAKGASGQVDIFAQGARPEGTFRQIEEPILKGSSNVYKYVFHYK